MNGAETLRQAFEYKQRFDAQLLGAGGGEWQSVRELAAECAVACTIGLDTFRTLENGFAHSWVRAEQLFAEYDSRMPRERAARLAMAQRVYARFPADGGDPVQVLGTQTGACLALLVHLSVGFCTREEALAEVERAWARLVGQRSN